MAWTRGPPGWLLGCVAKGGYVIDFSHPMASWVRAPHTREDLEKEVEAFKDVEEQLGISS